MVKNKYRSVRTETKVGRFDSKAEARYALQLETQKKAGKLAYYLRQVPFHLPGGHIYRCDFMEAWNTGDSEVMELHFVDVKGRDTPMSKLKRNQVEELYGVQIEVFQT